MVLDRVAIKTAAKEKISGNILTVFLASLIFGLMLSGISVVTGGLGDLVLPFIMGAFTLSFTIMGLNIVRKGKTEVGELFSGFSNYVGSLVLYILESIFIFLWTLLLIIPGIVACFKYAMAFYILADEPSIGANEALKKSKEMMNGYKWDFFVFQLSFIGWHLLGVITFGIAYIYVTPYLMAANAKYYEELKAKTGAAPAPAAEAPAAEAPAAE